MYGRNELIARYIKLRTGKTRTRKQVSSHIQVLARRKLREIQTKLKHTHQQDSNAKEKALQAMSSMSSAQIVSATLMNNKAAMPTSALPGIGLPPHPTYSSPVSPFEPTSPFPKRAEFNDEKDVPHSFCFSIKPLAQSPYMSKPSTVVTSSAEMGLLTSAGAQPPAQPPWEGRAIATPRLRLVEFAAFLETHREPDTYHKHLFVHLGGPTTYSDPLLEDEASAFYGVTSIYESPENMTVTVSTKVCSFGKQVVEKVETEYARFEGGRFVFRLHRSPMCDYMINFILKLKHLPEKYMMNSVLENFTILQVVTNRDTQETLLCIAYVFEVSTSEHGAQHHIYRLVKEPSL
ncbi:unnamed protein product [Darwinula stevensoni]|nr:unnamed protein product [Darwinula stevensoni]CAG0884723.1 unnamed protein product [Darwinula stevensoni]